MTKETIQSIDKGWHPLLRLRQGAQCGGSNLCVTALINVVQFWGFAIFKVRYFEIFSKIKQLRQKSFPFLLSFFSPIGGREFLRICQKIHNVWNVSTLYWLTDFLSNFWIILLYRCCDISNSRKCWKVLNFAQSENFRRVNHAHKLCTCQNNPSQNKNYPTNSLN